MKRPFFSIIIPTKSREKIISNAIDSILEQEFQDFEILVIDNNTNDFTQKVIDKYSDERILLIKTGGLGMPDNWEKGYEESKGQHLILLTDRMFFSGKDVLENIKKVILKYPNKIITYQWINENTKSINVKKNDNYEVEVINSKNVINSFFQGGKSLKWFDFRSPKGLNTSLPRSIYQDTKIKYDRICRPLSPDYTMAFTLLDQVSTIVHIPKPLIVSGSLNVSNGKLATSFSNKIKEYVLEVGFDYARVNEYVPIKTVSVLNLTYNDFFHLNDVFNWKYSWGQVNLIEYYALVYNEIIRNRDKTEKLNNIKEWIRSLSRIKFKQIWCVIQACNLSNKLRLYVLIMIISNKLNNR